MGAWDNLSAQMGGITRQQYAQGHRVYVAKDQPFYGSRSRGMQRGPVGQTLPKRESLYADTPAAASMRRKRGG